MFNFLKLSVALALVFLVGCGNVAENREEPLPTPAPTVRKPDAVEKLEYVQTGNFEFVFTFRRRDGGELESDDRIFLREKCGAEVNQWVVTDDKKMAIAGTNFLVEPKNMLELRRRFIVEDFSKNRSAAKDAGTKSNSNLISGNDIR